VKDRNRQNDSLIGQFKLPIDGFLPFQPLHLDVKLNNNGSEEASMFISITLERPISSTTDMLCYAAVNWVNVNPYPVSVKRMAIALATSSNQAI